jgi:hypothetical protein
MTRAREMLEATPSPVFTDREALAECIEACVDCAQACTACADACLAEPTVADLVRCIGLNLDCADVCEATACVLSRQTARGPEFPGALLTACAQACAASARECGQHSLMHEHCRICATACERCDAACRALIAAP